METPISLRQLLGRAALGTIGQADRPRPLPRAPPSEKSGTRTRGQNYTRGTAQGGPEFGLQQVPKCAPAPCLDNASPFGTLNV